MSACIIGRITVNDPQDYRAYATRTVALAENFGGRFLVKGGARVVVEGNCPDREAMLAVCNSGAYRQILPLALSSRRRDPVIVGRT